MMLNTVAAACERAQACPEVETCGNIEAVAALSDVATGGDSYQIMDAVLDVAQDCLACRDECPCVEPLLEVIKALRVRYDRQGVSEAAQ